MCQVVQTQKRASLKSYLVKQTIDPKIYCCGCESLLGTHRNVILLAFFHCVCLCNVMTIY